MWEALKDLVRSKVEYYRSQAKAIENPKATPEGPAARWTAWGTNWAAVVAALIAAFVFGLQLRAMLAANVSSENAEIVSDRPYVSFKSTQTVYGANSSEGGDPEYRIIPQWANEGRTPTKYLTMYRRGNFCQTNREIFIIPAGVKLTPMTMGPRATISSMAITVPKNVIADIICE